MICKFCGSRMDGARCPSCGKESPLVARSMQLDELSAKPAPNPKPAPAPNPSPAPSYDQGVRDGYQRGLQEGYKNGRLEGSAEASASGKGGIRPAVVALLCAACLLVAALVSGFVMRGVGRDEGAAQEKANHTPLPVPTVSSEQLSAEYDRGKTEGHTEGRAELEKELEQDSGMSLEELKAAFLRNPDEAKVILSAGELDQAKEEARKKGFIMALENIAGMNLPYYYDTNAIQQGDDIREIQTMLNNLGFSTGGVDGKYGRKTREAVIRFQLSAGLIPDDRDPRAGIMDLKTYAVLALAASENKTPADTEGAPVEDTPEPTEEPT